MYANEKKMRANDWSALQNTKIHALDKLVYIIDWTLTDCISVCLREKKIGKSESEGERKKKSET